MMTSGSVSVLLAVVLGSALTLAAQVLLELLRDGRKSEQLSHAIAGEIYALLQIVEARNYIETVKAHHAFAAAGTGMILVIPISQTYFSVIEANLQNIGLLPAELPLLIPKFLTLSKSALEDVSALNDGKWHGKEASELAVMYDGLRQVFEAAIATGRQIVSLIATIYGSPHGRYPPGLKLRMAWRKWLLRHG
jgi:hypothetical protein